MSMQELNTNEQNAAVAFNNQSVLFDELYSSNTIIQYKRNRVRQHVLPFLKPKSSILELNAGTGEDAVFFATLEHRVHVTDISTGMQNQLKEKIISAQFFLFATTKNQIKVILAIDSLKQGVQMPCMVGGIQRFI